MILPNITETRGGPLPPLPDNYRAVSFVALPEEDDYGVEQGWLAYCPELPGIVGQGKSAFEAIHDCNAGLVAAIQAYVDSDREIPWHPTTDRSYPVVWRGQHVVIPRKADKLT